MKRDGKLRETMPRHEWDMIWRYHEALMTAMSSAVLASDFANPLDPEAKSEDEGSKDDSGDSLEWDGWEDGSEDQSEDDSGDESGDGSEDESEHGPEDESEDGSEDESEDGSGVEEGGQVMPEKLSTVIKGAEGGRDEL